MGEELWHDVDRYFARALLDDDPALDAALADAAAAGLPPHEVSPLQGRLLEVLARSIGARRILEIGTLSGYSAIWLGRALPEGGELVTLERDPRAVEVARRNLARAGVGATVLEGDARETLATLDGPFDLVFIDADKRSNPIYLEHALRLSRPGTLVVADNAVRGGAVVGEGGDESAEGIRAFTAALAEEPRIVATAIQTVGVKGHDGFVVALVTA